MSCCRVFENAILWYHVISNVIVIFWNKGYAYEIACSILNNNYKLKMNHSI